jgi:hypothetical protein
MAACCGGLIDAVGDRPLLLVSPPCLCFPSTPRSYTPCTCVLPFWAVVSMGPWRLCLPGCPYCASPSRGTRCVCGCLPYLLIGALHELRLGLSITTRDLEGVQNQATEWLHVTATDPRVVPRPERTPTSFVALACCHGGGQFSGECGCGCFARPTLRLSYCEGVACTPALHPSQAEPWLS